VKSAARALPHRLRGQYLDTLSRLLQGPAPIDPWQRVAGVPAGATTCSNSTRYSPTTISVIDAPHALDSPYHRKPNVRSWPEPT